MIGASLLFGLWHVLPALHLNEINPIAHRLLGNGAPGPIAGVVLAVFGTFIAGLWLCFLCYRSGRVLAPMLAHAASNSFAFAIARVVTP